MPRRRPPRASSRSTSASGARRPGQHRPDGALWDKGVFGFKCFTAHSGIDEYGYLGYEGVKEVLAKLAELDAVLIVHAEDSRILAEAPQDITDQYATFLASRPRAAENTAIEQVLAAARETGARVHILHLSSAEALPAIRAAKQEGVKVTVETCPHYLTFASELIPDGATEYKCCPPLRENDNRKALWEGLKDGTIDHIASDHSPCTVDLKVKDTGDFGKAWGGVASVQLGLPAVWTAGEEFGIELSDIARWLAANPCASFRVPGKGSIRRRERRRLRRGRPRGDLRCRCRGPGAQEQDLPLPGAHPARRRQADRAAGPDR